MYAIYAYIDPQNHPNVSIYGIHGVSGYNFWVRPNHISNLSPQAPQQYNCYVITWIYIFALESKQTMHAPNHRMVFNTILSLSNSVCRSDPRKAGRPPNATASTDVHGVF